MLCQLGGIEPEVPRTHRYYLIGVLRSYACRAPEINRVILAGFMLGLFTRKIGGVLLPLLGRAVPSTTVSPIARTLDAAVARARPAPAPSSAPCWWPSASSPTGAGRYVDLQLARAESVAVWEHVLVSLYRHGLTSEGPEMICADGGNDLLARCRYSTPDERKMVHTTNATERRFREVRRQTRPMGTFQDRTSMDRILFTTFSHHNKNTRNRCPFLPDTYILTS